MKAIQHIDASETTMVARWPREGTAAIEVGGQMLVDEGQEAIVLRNDEALDTFGPGRHTLAIGNLQIVGRTLDQPAEDWPPFQATVVFVATRPFPDLKWGTKEPIAYPDPELGAVRLRAYGRFGVRITNPRQFVAVVVGALDIGTTDGLVAHFRSAIVGRLTELLSEGPTSMYDLPRVQEELSDELAVRVSTDFNMHGIDLMHLDIGGITPPRNVPTI